MARSHWRSGQYREPVEPLGEGVGLRHQLTSGGGTREQVGQPCVGGERNALLDAELLEHGQEEPVPLVDDLALVDLVQPRPVVDPARLVPGPGSTVRRDDPRRLRVRAIGVGVDAYGVDQRLRPLRVRVEGAEPEHDVHPGGPLDVPAFTDLRRLLTRRDDHMAAATSGVGTHLADHRVLALPEVRQAARGRTRGQLDDEGPGLVEVEEVEDVGGGRVGRDQAESVAVADVVDQVGARRPEHLVVLVLPLRVRHQRQRPEVDLARHLEVELVEHPPEVLAAGKLAVHRDLRQCPRKGVLPRVIALRHGATLHGPRGRAFTFTG